MFESRAVRENFLSFFQKKGHQLVPSSSLIPDDPSVLLTTAGIQQFIPYFTAEAQPSFKRACAVQKCFRINDIESVGDQQHHTFFEMLGNWSFNDYFKSEAIEFALELLVKEFKLSPKRLWPTVFKGEGEMAPDKESFSLWVKMGFDQKQISSFGLKENFWGPPGRSGPCGPCSEIHYDLTQKACQLGQKCRPNCPCGRFVEIWNLVFIEYLKDEKGRYRPLAQRGVDTGAGLERLTAVLQHQPSAYQTDLFLPLIKKIAKLMPADWPTKEKVIKERIMADHLRAVCFLIAEGILPSNIERGYILRRLLRRIIGQARILSLSSGYLIPLAQKVVELYGPIYPELKNKKTEIITVIKNEEEKFNQTIERGLVEFEKMVQSSTKKLISGTKAFYLFATYGLPLEMIKDLAWQKGLALDEVGFERERKKHQEISRAGMEKKFGGHGLGETRIFSRADEEKVKKLHTATHLLHQALEDVLGPGIQQMGSDINPQRLRFDFNYPQKLTAEQIKAIEERVNQKIKEDLPIDCQKMDLVEAVKKGAKAFFKKKYSQQVQVYSIGDYSKEVCAGPHVQSTGQLGRFKIQKEESSGAGIRRIKAVLE